MKKNQKVYILLTLRISMIVKIRGKVHAQQLKGGTTKNGRKHNE